VNVRRDHIEDKLQGRGLPPLPENRRGGGYPPTQKYLLALASKVHTS